MYKESRRGQNSIPIFVPFRVARARQGRDASRHRGRNVRRTALPTGGGTTHGFWGIHGVQSGWGVSGMLIPVTSSKWM